MRPARTPFTTPAHLAAASPLSEHDTGPASGAPDGSVLRAMSRRAILGALAGAGAATLLGAGSAAARQAGDRTRERIGGQAGHGPGNTLLIEAFPDAERERMRLARAPIDSAGVAAPAALGLPKPPVDPGKLTDRKRMT
ncbi:hypothetical protein ACFV8T_22160 [Streptomyces sp. NPDC059832]|uniref:hypothetical protein n=1 Tax=unclassified Streptomyces TaxID=2593676 RepID=UPI0036470236